MRSIIMFLFVVACPGCGDIPDPDQTGRIRGTVADGGVSGCAEGQVGRTLTYFTHDVRQSPAWASATRTWCCPAGSTFAQCPGRALLNTACMGDWPGQTCPTTLFVGRACATNADCPTELRCEQVVANGARFCTSPCSVIPGGGLDECTPLRGECMPTRGNEEGRCFPRCTLPNSTDFSSCSIGVCAIASDEPPGSRRGICYPTSR